MINEVLIDLRTFFRLNQSELAKNLGCSKSHISEIETGKKKVTIDLLNNYCEFFNLPLSSIVSLCERQPLSIKQTDLLRAFKCWRRINEK
ncbi:helix-turn-helix domain-containing protein [Photobacterium obscurum]|uniref:helix-turn-helix domain-containing protein n=1 Tax=Photobacterium obscurum TaxID=2829490 RepID=UPI00389A8310